MNKRIPIAQPDTAWGYGIQARIALAFWARWSARAEYLLMLWTAPPLPLPAIMSAMDVGVVKAPTIRGSQYVNGRQP